MNENLRTGIVLAALELVPGEPSDLSDILRTNRTRRRLFEAFRSAGDDISRTTPYTPVGPHPELSLVDYLEKWLDVERIRFWSNLMRDARKQQQYSSVIAGDEGYPSRLASCWDSPPILFHSDSGHSSRTSSVQPSLDDLARPALAVVGARTATDFILSATGAVVRFIAAHDVRIVSGLALGVDSTAHQAALDVGAPTTAVIGTGIENIYPPSNRDLARRICENGIIISQFAPLAPRTGTTFLRRNCTIAALSDVSLIMDGEERSGSRHEIMQAMRYGKPVLLWKPALQKQPWARTLAQDAHAHFVETVEEVLMYVRMGHANRNR